MTNDRDMPRLWAACPGLVRATLLGALVLAPQATRGAQPRASLPDELRREKIWQAGPACGPNSLYFYLRLNGIGVDHRELLRDLAPTERGCSLEALRTASASRGLAARVVKTTPEGLAAFNPPYVVHFDLPGELDHFATVINMGRNEATLVDGSEGAIVYMSRVEFNEQWSGYLLVRDDRRRWTTWLVRAVKAVFVGEVAMLGLAVPWCLMLEVSRHRAGSP